MNSTAPVTSLWEVRLADGSEKKMSVMELDHAFEEGVVDTSTMVREVGTTEWEPLGRVAGLEAKKDDERDPPASSIEAAAPMPMADRVQRARKIAAIGALSLGAAFAGAAFVAALNVLPHKLLTKRTPAAAVVITPTAAPPQEALIIGPPPPPSLALPSDHTPPEANEAKTKATSTAHSGASGKKRHTKGKVRLPPKHAEH